MTSSETGKNFAFFDNFSILVTVKIFRPSFLLWEQKNFLHFSK